MNQENHVLIVGGTKGLGKVIAERYLAQNYFVTVLSRKNDFIPNVSHYRHISVDLETLTDPTPIVEEVIAKTGPVRYMVFCQRYRGKEDTWTGELKVSLTATNLFINAFSDHFCQTGDKAIAVVSSVYAHFVGGSQPASYHVAKAGLNQLVKYYAWEIGKKSIRINAIMPLTYLKPESQDFYLAKPELMTLYQKFVPLKRIGDVNDSANLIEFLCSEKASFINGQSIFVDGGTSIVWPEELAKSFSNI